MNDTGIIWTEATWNPMSGCQKISQGCKFCYAETVAENKRGTKAFPNGFDLTIREHKLKEPFRLKTPTLIFANSMSDLFWDKVPNEYRHRIVDVIEQTPQHEYQVLTKRPDIMLAFSKERQLPPNFWAGVTVEDNRVKERLAILRQIKAEIKFVSAEPLIARLDLVPEDLETISWMISGGESGSHLYDPKNADRSLTRYVKAEGGNKGRWEVIPERMDWIRHLRDVCIASETKFFHKQWGGAFPEAAGRLLDGRTWNEIPRLPGGRKEIDNDYLKHLESKNAGTFDESLAKASQ
jgi:protein gp37